MLTGNYCIDKAAKNVLEEQVKAASKKLNEYPREANGLTPASTKAMVGWQEAKIAYGNAFNSLRKFNGAFCKRYKKEIRAERKVKAA